jgi:polyisoprenoid-binding protein YceI
VDAIPALWQIDPARSFVEFSTNHMLVSTVTGRLGSVSGTLRFDPPGAAGSAVEATVQIAALNTRQPARDAFLRSAEFLDVERYPAARFESTRVQHFGGEKYLVAGRMTVKDVTREVSLYVRVAGPPSLTPQARRLAFDARTSIKRSAFDLRWSPALEAGGFVVSDEIKVSIHAEAIRA